MGAHGDVALSLRCDAGSGTAWLLPFVNGAPPIGWGEASKYLLLPALLVVAQFASSAIISPVKKDDVSALLPCIWL